jgi:hypothetical protein
MTYPGNKASWVLKAVWFLSIAFVGYLSLAPRVEIPCQFSGADKLAHCLAYAWLAGLPIFALGKRELAFLGATLMLPFGIGLEVAQAYVPGREFSVADMIADAAGVVLGMIVAGYVKQQIHIDND